MAGSISVDGVDAFKEHMTRLQGNILSKGMEAITNASDKLGANIQKEFLTGQALKVQTNNLRSGIKPFYPKNRSVNTKKISGGVTSTALSSKGRGGYDYGAYWEYSSYIINLSGLASYSRTSHAFMRPAFEESRDDLESLIKSTLEGAFNGV